MTFTRIGVAAALAAALLAAPVAANAAVGTGPQGSYIVTLNTRVGLHSAGVATAARRVAARYGAHVTHTYTAALSGFAATLPAGAAVKMSRDPAVALVEPNRPVRMDATQVNPPAWGLDRIDQRALPLNHSYTYPARTTRVRAYVLDTGVRVTHGAFGGRAFSGYDAVDKDRDASDCHGHGTHVAGILGGTKYGVAKNVTLIAVRVLDCDGNGDDASVIAGIDWVTAHAARPAVANMSIGGPPSRSLDAAVRRSIATGISYGVAAGNGDEAGHGYSACEDSPARVNEALTVGATGRTDYRPTWSNHGRCVDLYAPGVGIRSAWGSGNSATSTLSGTSMATPHVSGAAALYLAAHPGAGPAQVQQALRSAASQGKVRGIGPDSPNRLLRVV